MAKHVHKRDRIVIAVWLRNSSLVGGAVCVALSVPSRTPECIAKTDLVTYIRIIPDRFPLRPSGYQECHKMNSVCMRRHITSQIARRRQQ